ncbi:prostaglandin E2 receptor EP1 subtype [Podarcis raffonei]|uniref:prostaglandin E2 receptor EP1 subtype n=1 Tax=Podarcis raffonei TaxID=65483 RepID=UPI002329238C|nr:prostaglandin E2 receptor EP1 subtype [Podarcis raffonei]XP_053232284.1 prostaglandin E2 receptor EP1 subtype [Podarcis raffonei]XP_053232285.1 prostaglandin E2 receptor EP1 subtype [Podarcis raffonei]XP_053232286.1 prostaglandin E2 receptor EP1 subtype [Podarcis raffonei]XP_053232287.1 prostaglandin E2 receptor EP1 subtype [Podarcis raffonei]XP_053232288.1 prostaglandin E2 receptor EP1 subtype [Podarcis raffonei]
MMSGIHSPNASQASPVNHSSCCTEPTKIQSSARASSPAAPIFSMTLGAVSNVVALAILVQSYTRFRRRSKATFLLYASSLVITDLAGHVIPGSFVLRLYATQSNWEKMDPSKSLCQFFGASMVFFGLCPLFLGCIMAVERCVGITRPLLHASLVTPGRTKLSLLGLWGTALAIALLPLCSFGSYVVQAPGTWCFIKVREAEAWPDVGFALLFSTLGLASLVASLFCNTFSGLNLVRARLRSQRKCGHRRAKAHDIEMVVQLVGIMVVSCICWSPLLVFVILSVTNSHGDLNYKELLFLGVRLASWNQILDPWVYILLRRAVLRKLLALVIRRPYFKGVRFDRWEASSFQSSERSIGLAGASRRTSTLKTP